MNKKNNKCKEIELKIIEGISDEDLRLHLEDCKECKDFAKFATDLHIVMDEKIRGMKVPEELNAAVKSAASKHLITGRVAFFSVFWKRIVPLSIAAGLLIISSLIFIDSLKNDTKEEKPTSGMNWESMVVPK